MKTLLCISLLGLLTAFSGRAQTSAYYENTKADSRAYWEVITDYQTNGTAIRYYDAEKHLMHQEVLPNKMVRLTRYNVRRLNEALIKVSSNKPEASQVRTADLPTATEDPRIARARDRIMAAERKASSEEIVARIVPKVDGTNAYLKVFLYNPKEYRLRIDILNSKGTIVCQEYENRFQSVYRFSMNNLPQGEYRVQIYKSWEIAPAVTNLFSLSYKPSQVFLTTKFETQKDTNGLVSK